MGEIYKDPPQSRGEAILRATIDSTDYNDPPQSRVEDLLIELKETIEAGGGGGGAVIDDNTPSTHKVYSSSKVEELVDDKKSVESVDINTANNHLVVTYDDGTTHDAGEIPGGTTPEYPAYAATERDLVYAAVKSYISSLDNPIIIGFNTDQHIDSESSSSGTVATRNEVTYGLKTLRDLTKMLPFNVVVLGGDTHGSGAGTISSMQNSSLYINAQMVGTNAPLVAMTGNHEGGQDNQTITRDQVLKSHMTASMQNKTITLVDKISGYFDDPTCKVRFVFLDAFARTQVSYMSTQYNAVLNTILSGIPAGYKAIIFSHHPLDENLPQVAERKGWNNPASCHATLQLYKDKIIACFCGHVHNNLNVDQDGITFVSTTCAGKYELNDGSTRTNGTASVTAYDVFVIDQTAEKIYAVRYGNGQNREISYAHETPVVPRGNILQNVTWTDGYRLNSSGQLVEQSGYSTTEIIEDVNAGDILYFADGTLPMHVSTWTEYADDGTTVGNHAGISTTDYGATYDSGKMYFELLNSSDGKVISYNWYGVNTAKSGETTNKYGYGELELWNSGYVKSVKLAYDSSHFQTAAKIRFTFPTDKKASLDIRVNEPIAPPARGNILANITWEDGKRINSSGALADESGYSTTQIIDNINAGDTLYFADGTLPVNVSNWTCYSDDGQSTTSMSGISTETYGATYTGSKMYFQMFNSSDTAISQGVSFWYRVLANAKNPNDQYYGNIRFLFGETEFYQSGYIKSVKLCYDGEHFPTCAKMRFTFPTAKKGSLDIRVNEPFDET